MTNPSVDIFFHWLVNTPELLQRSCVVIVITYVAIRLKWFRKALRSVHTHWRARLVAGLFFGGLGIIGSHSGIILDVSHGGSQFEYLSKLPTGLQPLQAILSFRDTMVISAGLYAGPWVGLVAGLIAGGERHFLGSFVGFSSGLATVVLGLGAGLAQQLRPQQVLRPYGVLVVVLLGSCIQKLMIAYLSHPKVLVIATIQETVIPETVVNCFGCLLLISVLKDLERERLKKQIHQAELRALQAQIEPHFINNALNAIKALIRIDSARASEYVVKLARFLDDTRQIAKANSISLGKELEHLERYLDFQQLRFPGLFKTSLVVPAELHPYQIPPRSLLTLTDNALLHGLRNHTGILLIEISTTETESNFTLYIKDNGCGISEPRMESLGNKPVDSERGSGTGLFQLNENLTLAFDGKAHLSVKSQEGKGTEVSLLMPKRIKPW
ncbi:MAG: LytS/YhcK type 5TM receptor domain-containing protein [Methyloglobulus sp.]|nr:histidine kinase [Methyloglobulus sp.]